MPRLPRSTAIAGCVPWPLLPPQDTFSPFQRQPQEAVYANKKESKTKRENRGSHPPVLTLGAPAHRCARPFSPLSLFPLRVVSRGDVFSFSRQEAVARREFRRYKVFVHSTQNQRNRGRVGRGKASYRPRHEDVQADGFEHSSHPKRSLTRDYIQPAWQLWLWVSGVGP